MDVLVLIDKLDDVVHNARPVPLTDQVRVDREEIYDLLDQMRATIPEEIKQARWIVKERQEMLAEAKREAERIVREAREQQARLISDEEVTKQAERAADEIVEDARTREREIRLGAEDYADEILNTLEVNLQKFLAAVQRGRDRLAGRGTKSRPPSSTSSLSVARGGVRVPLLTRLTRLDRSGPSEVACWPAAQNVRRGTRTPLAGAAGMPAVAELPEAGRRRCGSAGTLRPDHVRALLELQVLQRRPAGVGGLLVFVVGGVGVVEGLAADGAEAGAVGAAEEAGGEGEQGRVVGPAADVELVVGDVGAAQLLVLGRGLVDLAGLDLEVERARLEAAHAGALEVDRELEAEGEAAAGPGDLEPHGRRGGVGEVGLAAQLEGLELDRELDSLALAVGQREAREVDDRRARLGHERTSAGDGLTMTPSRRGYEMGQFDWKPEIYLERIRAEIPGYDELQDQAVAAIPFAPERVLELGMGTGETTRRLIEAHPDAWVVGLDSSPDMVFRARQSYDDVQLARMEDPLPDGPWDLVISRPLGQPARRRAEAEPLPPGQGPGPLPGDRRRLRGRPAGDLVELVRGGHLAAGDLAVCERLRGAGPLRTLRLA